MKRANAKIGDSTGLARKAIGCVAASLLVGTSLVPVSVNAQTTVAFAPDNDGANDEQEQSDLTGVVRNCSATPGTIDLSVLLDPVSNSGGNSSDISILFDTDGDGNADYSYVVTLGNSPFQILNIQLQRGRNDSQPLKIAGNTTVVSPTGSTGSLSIGTNPFDGGQDTSVDLNLDLQAIASHAGVPLSSVEFVNITTIPSSSATSDPKDVLLSTTQAFSADDADATDVDATVVVDAFANDSTRIDWSTAQIETQPSNGSATINPDGTITYVPNGDYTGQDTFTYSALGIDCATYTSTVTIDITGIAAVDESATRTWILEGEPGVLSVLDNDSIDGAAANFSNVTLALAPGATVPADLTFGASTGLVGITGNSTPGTYSFDYQICRSGAPTDCKTATATVTIVPADADFSITKVNGTDIVTSGLTTTYTVSVTNNGADPVGGATVSDTPGAGITCEATAPVTITGDGVPAGSFTFADLSGPGIVLGTLTNGQTTTLTYSCQVN